MWSVWRFWSLPTRGAESGFGACGFPEGSFAATVKILDRDEGEYLYAPAGTGTVRVRPGRHHLDVRPRRLDLPARTTAEYTVIRACRLR